MKTIALAVNIMPNYFDKQYHDYSFHGIYSDLEIAKEKVEQSIKDTDYTGTWREPLVGEALGYFANYAADSNSLFVYELKSSNPVKPDFSILLGLYEVKEQ